LTAAFDVFPTRSVICALRLRIRTTASLADDTRSLIWRASVNCSSRSASVTFGAFVFRRISNRCVRLTPPAVNLTAYCPGGACGPRVEPAHMISPGNSRALG